MVRSFDERDGKPFAIENGPVNLGIAVDVTKKDGSHSLMVPAIKGSQDLDFAGFHTAFEDLIAKTRENKLTADDFQRHQHQPHQPGRDRHRRLGAAPAGRPERDHRHRLDRLPAGVVARLAGTDQAARRLEDHDADLDLRPPRHPGRRVGRVPAPGRAAAAGRGRLLRGASPPTSASRPRRSPTPTPPPPRPRRSPPRAPAAESSGVPGKVDEELLQAVQAATSLLKAYRTQGHLAARLDPLGSEPKGDPGLEPENLNLTPELMARIPASILRIGVPGETLLEALPRMRDAYCCDDRLPVRAHRLAPAADLDARDDRDRRPPPAARRGRERAPAAPADRRLPVRALPRENVSRRQGLLDRGARRDRADARRGRHPRPPRRRRRGRLRHGPPRPAQRPRPQPRPLGRIDPRRVRGLETTERGEVRSRRSRTAAPATSNTTTATAASTRASPGEKTSVRLYPNPSHLEFVDPVVTGGARFLQNKFDGSELNQDTMRAVPVLLHGDAAFPAQGVVAETLNLQSLNGYSTGGTVHIIQDNQVGFTTDPEDARSTPYAGDLAKGFNVPIIHVNADDVEACMSAVRLAMAYRERWHRDVVIDVIGYRRFGHNETDEPAYTQPIDRREDQGPEAGLRALRRPADRRGRDHRRDRRRGGRLAQSRDVGGAEGPARADGRGRLRGPDRRHRHRRTRPHRQPAGRHRADRRHADPPERGTAAGPGRLQRPQKAPPPARPAHRRARRRRHRLRPGRGARLQLAAHRRRPHPAHRPGHRARHLLPPPPRPARREHRPRVHADAAPERGEGAVRAAQQPALGDRLPRLRVRLLGGDAERAGPLGGAVRRLRQRGAGDHRQLHRLRRGQVGPDQPPDDAAAARLRGLRAGALERPDRALPGPRRRGQHPDRQPDHRRPVLPPAAPPGADQEGAPADRLHAEGAAAARPRRPRRWRT